MVGTDVCINIFFVLIASNFSIGTCVYIVLQLFHLSAQEPVYLIFFQQQQQVSLFHLKFELKHQISKSYFHSLCGDPHYFCLYQKVRENYCCFLCQKLWIISHVQMVIQCSPATSYLQGQSRLEFVMELISSYFSCLICALIKIYCWVGTLNLQALKL